MFITAELLRKHDACGPGLKYVERFYPNGVEMIDLIRDHHMHKSFLHWGREHLTHTEEEFKAYCEACKIVNCERFWKSQNISNCTDIMRSKNVEDSSSIFDSCDIIRCKDVLNSENIEDSEQILHSSIVENCQKIFKGINIIKSENICYSTMVSNSKNVTDSFNVFDSSEIIKCKSVSNSYFCNNCENLKYSMFCNGIANNEYCIFNVPIDKNHYEIFEKQYKKYVCENLDFIDEWPTGLSVNSLVAPTRKFDDWYHPISDKFWKWVKTLPGYDSMLLYNITMLPELLKD